jgi:hypothetical protein
MIAHRDVFDAEYTARLNRLRSDAAASLEGWKADVGKIGREMDRLVDAIVGDVPAVKVKDRMIELDARKSGSTDISPTEARCSSSSQHRRTLSQGGNEAPRRAERTLAARGGSWNHPRAHRQDRPAAARHGAKSLAIDPGGHLAGMLLLAEGRRRGRMSACDQHIKLVAGGSRPPLPNCCAWKRSQRHGGGRRPADPPIDGGDSFPKHVPSGFVGLLERHHRRTQHPLNRYRNWSPS